MVASRPYLYYSRNTAPSSGILAMVESFRIPEIMSWMVVGYRFAVADTSPESIPRFRRMLLYTWYMGPAEQTRRQSQDREEYGRCSKIETTGQPYRLPEKDFLPE